MENEQEGIELETTDLEQDGIQLPDVEETETEETQDTSETDTQNSVDDDEKESLKRGVNKERNLRKAAEKKARELEEKLKSLEEASKTPSKTTVEKLIEDGIDESVAKSIAKAIDNSKPDNSKLEKELADVKFDNALTKKSKEEGYEDIVDYADEIKDLVDKGLTIEQSYHAVTYNKSKTQDTKSEIERKVEAKLQNNQARKEILGNYNSNSGAINNSKAKVQATAEEKGIAAMAGMTVEEYVALRDMDNVKDYNKYKSRTAKK